MAEGSAARDLATLFRSGTAAGLTDGEILRRAARATGEEGEMLIGAIVDRHGPMVLRVCRGVLGDGADADDAFQATFLVLAQRLREAGRPESVGGWLHGVASRVAARARVDAARRRRLDRGAARLAVVAADPPDVDRDRAVQEEVGRLPSRYREVVVLCFWEGLTQEQAADRLGRPIGTVRSRSARARDLLRRRLIARGLAPDGFETPSPAVPPTLALAAARGAAELAAGRPTLALVGAHALELSRHVTRRMLMTRFAPVATVAALTLATAAGLGRAGTRQDPDASAPPATIEKAKEPAPALPVAGVKRVGGEGAGPAASTVTPARKTRTTLSEYLVEPPDTLRVDVLDALENRPIIGERLVRPDGRISLGFYGEVYVAGLTIVEVKEKVVDHLRNYLSDESLGLVRVDPATGREFPIAPRDTNRVSVDVSAYNSKVVYALGAFNSPSRIPFTGSDTLLDLVVYAGGLVDDADAHHVLLVRENPKPGEPKTEMVDVEAIIRGDDASRDFQLWPGDRLIAKRRDDAPSPRPNPDAPRQADPAGVQERLERIEARLDLLLKRLGE